jgi:hypothetical protein
VVRRPKSPSLSGILRLPQPDYTFHGLKYPMSERGPSPKKSFAQRDPLPTGTRLYISRTQVPDERTWPVAQKVLRSAGSFAYRNPIIRFTDRASRENPFANRDSSLSREELTIRHRVDTAHRPVAVDGGRDADATER